MLAALGGGRSSTWRVVQHVGGELTRCEEATKKRFLLHVRALNRAYCNHHAPCPWFWLSPPSMT